MATETTDKTYTPGQLAEELSVDAKRIRAFLRTEFPREAASKNTSWMLSEDVAELVRDRFTPKAEEADVEDEDPDEVEEV
jgi:hypothetical protein